MGTATELISGILGVAVIILGALLHRERRSRRNAPVDKDTTKTHAHGPSLVVGDPRDAREFATRNAAFLAHLPRLKTLVESTFSRELEMTPADLVVMGSAHLCAQDYSEILTLAANGFGIGALKLLRSHYEHAIVGAYINDHPEDAQKFIHYHPVQVGKRAGRILKEFKGILPEERMARFRELENEGQKAGAAYRVPVCGQCGTTRVNHTWGMDFVAMAGKVKEMGAMIVECYYDPLQHAHGTYHAIASRIVRDGEGFRFDDGPQPGYADHAVRNGHFILLLILQVVIKRFDFADVKEEWEGCMRDFRAIWLDGRVGREAAGTT